MPNTPLRPCKKPGCTALIREGAYCEKHGGLTPRRDYRAENRGRVRCGWYDTKRWKRMSKDQLRKQPLCEECLEHNQVREAKHADHEVPHKGDAKLFFDTNNLRSLCPSCHSRKTAKEDGGFGNR